MINQTPYLSVIIPAYNEESRIPATLEAVYAYLQAQPFTWEMVIVIDGATDGTRRRVEAYAAGKDGIRWIDRTQNRGKGYTVREGMLAATGQIRLFTDADNSTDITHFDRMRPLFESGYDIVIGTRDPKDAAGAQQAVPQSFIKRTLGNLGNLIVQVMAVPGIWDTQCGFKAFSAESAESIFPRLTIDRWGFDIEALAVARRLGYRIGIIPTYWVNADGTHVRSSDYVTTILETVKIRWNLLTGKYNT